MSILSLPEFVSVSDLQRGYATVLKKLKAKQKPLFVMKKNKVEAILISPESYQSLISELERHEMKSALRAIKIYKKEKENGKLKLLGDPKELFE
jgi:PHD/YefM family antitoxin component YafN of YafNO toxin-antitoxin module